MSRQPKPKRLTRVYVIAYTGSRQEIPSCLVKPNTFFRRSDAVALQRHIVQIGGIALQWDDYSIRTFVLAR